MYLKKMDAKITTLDNKLDNLESEMLKLGTDMTKVWNYVHDNVKDSNMKLTETQTKLEAMEFTLGLTSDKLEHMQKERDSMKEDIIYMKSQSMRSNLIFSRIQEESDETPEKTEKIVRDFLVDKLKLSKEKVDDIKFERVHRMGNRAWQGYSRNIVAKFTLFKDRECVKQQRINLKGTNFSVYEQFPREINDRRKALLPQLKAAKSNNHRAWISYDTLYIDGRPVRGDAPQDNQ